jgi:hypothetical protein
LKRRSFIVGTFALSACSPAQRVIETPSAPLIPSLRMPADAPLEVWARHLDIERMRGSPNILALSAGGEDGAFGAGVLTGWTQRGDRPEFDVVTGVSTGALMAPFAFLGPDRDDALRRIYTTYSGEDILENRGLSGVFSDALASSKPMERVIERHLPGSLIDKIAEEWRTGRRLFVVTSNLDTRRAMVWDMGAIADARQHELFRAVTLGSASIPGLFPPVNLAVGDVTEAHLYGGVHMQLLEVPQAAFSNMGQFTGRRGSLYILVNNTLEASPAPVARRSIPIMQQTFSTMIRSSAAQSVAIARRYAGRTDMRFAVATIGTDFDVPWDPSVRFSQDYMTPLFEYGRTRALSGDAWARS